MGRFGTPAAVIAGRRRTRSFAQQRFVVTLRSRFYFTSDCNVCVFWTSGRLISAQEEFRRGRAAAVHTGGVLQRARVQHPRPLHHFIQTVLAGQRETRRRGEEAQHLFLISLHLNVCVAGLSLLSCETLCVCVCSSFKQTQNTLTTQ